MLNVILIILKIIGITLAVLVGLILLIVLLLLLVPFRYSGDAKYPVEGENDMEAKSKAMRDKLKSKVMAGQEVTEGVEEAEKQGIPLKAHGRVTWLLHILKISIDYDNTGNILVVKLFGIKLMSTDPEDVKKKEEKDRKKREKRKKKQEKLREKRRKKREKEKAKRKKAAEKRKKAAAKAQGKAADKPVTDAAVNAKAEAKQDTKPAPGTEVKPAAGDGAGSGEKSEVKKHEAKESEAKKSFDDLTGDELDELLDEELGSGKGTEKKSIVERIKSIYNKADDFITKLKTYKSFSEDFRVRKALKYSWKKVKLVLKRVLPRKLQGHLKYGFDNPSTTGYVSAAAAMFVGRWDGHVEIKPDFEEKVLNADIDFKGKIRLAGVGIPALKVWLNKDVKYLRREFEKLKKGKYIPPDQEAGKENNKEKNKE